MPESNSKRQRGRSEFAAAHYARRLGEALRSEMQEKERAASNDDSAARASHGEDAASWPDPVPPSEDRAG